jgi:hypothetical protein
MQMITGFLSNSGFFDFHPLTRQADNQKWQYKLKIRSLRHGLLSKQTSDPLPAADHRVRKYFYYH